MKLLMSGSAIQVRLAAAVMCKSPSHSNIQDGRYAGHHSIQVAVAKMFKPVCYNLALHSKPCSGSAMKAHSMKQEVKVTAPIAARTELGLERPSSRVIPGLRGRGIGQRWVEARQKEQGRGNVGTERTVCSSTTAVRKSRRGASNVFLARAGNSWVCSVCRTIVYNHAATQVTCRTERCPGRQSSHKAAPTAPVIGRAQTESDEKNEAKMEQLIAEMLHDGVPKKDAKKRKRSSAKAAGGGWGGRWVQWVVYTAGATLALLGSGIVLHQAIAPSRFDTPDPRVPKADFGTSPDVNPTLSTGPYTPFAAVFEIVVEATGEYAAVPLPLAQVTLHEVEKEPVVRGGRELVGARGVERYEYEEKGVGQDVVSDSSGHDADVGVEAQPEGIAEIVVDAAPQGIAATDTRPARKMWKRLSGWCESHREDAGDFLNGPWY